MNAFCAVGEFHIQKTIFEKMLFGLFLKKDGNFDDTETSVNPLIAEDLQRASRTTGKIQFCSAFLFFISACLFI